MARRRDFQSISSVLGEITGEMQPQTALAKVQSAWPEAVGQTIASWARPVSERAGVVTIACTDSMVAHELEMMRPELVKKLEKKLAGAAPSELKFVVR